MKLTIRLLEGELAVVRLPTERELPEWVPLGKLVGPICSVSRSEKELSVICAADCVPAAAEGMRVERGWRALRLEDQLDFSAVGILRSLLEPLAGAGISILSLSTFDTDYVLVPAGRLEAALGVLKNGFEVA